MRTLFLALLFALCSHPVLGQEQRASDVIQSELIEAPDEVAPGRLISIKLPPNLPFEVTPKPENKLSFIDEETGRRAYLILEAKAPGYTITINYAVTHPTDEEIKTAPWDDREAFKKWLADKRTDEVYRDTHFIKVGKSPDPEPDPDPDPDPSPAPIPEPGFRVLIFYEKDDTIPALQQAILAGEEVATYLNNACVTEPDGTAAYRIYDKDADLSNELPVWQKAFQRRPQETPWVIISNGATGYEGPLPKSPSEFINLCKKYEK